MALCAVLPPEGVQAVNNVLATFADHPKTPLATAIAYRQLIYAAEPLAEEFEPARPRGGILGTLPRETVH